MARARRVAVALLLAVLIPSTLHAEPDGRSRRAVESANAGLKLYEHGKWDDALAKFREAEGLYHSPVFVLYRARTLGRAGRWRQALAVYEEVLREALPSDAPAAWRDALRDARSEKTALELEIPSVIVECPPGARVTVDGEPVAAGEEIALDPGRHLILAREGSRSTSREVRLEQKQKRRRVTLAFPPAPARTHEPGWLTPGSVVTGLGGATLLAGGVVGVVALSAASRAKDDLPETCDGNVCPRSRRGEVESTTANARTLGNVSTGLVIGGAVVLAGGIVLWLSQGDAQAQTAKQRRTWRVEF